MLQQFPQSGAIYPDIPEREIRILYYTLTSIWSSRVKNKLLLLRKKLFINKGLNVQTQQETSFASPNPEPLRPPALTCYSDMGVPRLTRLHRFDLALLLALVVFPL